MLQGEVGPEPHVAIVDNLPGIVRKKHHSNWATTEDNIKVYVRFSAGWHPRSVEQ